MVCMCMLGQNARDGGERSAGVFHACPSMQGRMLDKLQEIRGGQTVRPGRGSIKGEGMESMLYSSDR